MGKKRRLGRPARVRLWPALAVLALLALTTGCARLLTETTLRAQVLEAPRKREVPVGARALVLGQRAGLTVHAQVFTESRCADELRQNARGFATTVTRADGQSLLAEWLFGGVLTALGGAGLGWTATHAALPDEPPSAQASRYQFTGALAAIGLAFVAAATWQTSSLGTHERDLGVKELIKQTREHGCGRAARPNEALRLTLCDGKQLLATADAAGIAAFALPEDIDARIASEGTDRAILEVLSDVHGQTVLHLAAAVTPAN